MSNTAGPQMPAGWFRDPGGTDQLRWWDGTAWTSHLAPVPVPQPVAPTPPVVPTPAFSPTATYDTNAQADPTERAYVPFQNSWNNSDPAQSDGEFARPVQWNTGGVWVLAASIILYYLVIGLITLGYAFAFGFSQLETITNSISQFESEEFGGAGVLIWVLVLILAASRDQARLQRFGYTKRTSVLWILLIPPLVYLIIRTVRVRRESGHGLAPLIFYIVQWVLISVGTALLVLTTFAAVFAHVGVGSVATNTQDATSLASGIASGMNKTGGNYSVSCTPFAEPTKTPVDVTCQAVDTGSNVSHTLQIEIDPGLNGGQPTFKLLSVTPPISQ